MTETQDIPWKRISIEATAIVASILLAFAIDAWWAEIQEREFEQETLIALLEEFHGHRSELTFQRRGHERLTGAIGGLISFAQTGVLEPDQFSIDRSMFYLRVPATTDFGSGVRDALLSSGRIEVISDKRLRYEIAEWSSVLDELKDDQQIGVELVLNLVIPYLAREGVPASRFATLAPDSPMTTGSRSLEANPDLLKQLFDDPEFHTILETRYGFLEHTIVEYDDLIVATNSIIAKIEASLTDANQ